MPGHKFIEGAALTRLGGSNQLRVADVLPLAHA